MWSQQHTGTEQGMALPSFLIDSVETEVKGIFPGAGPWVFRLVSIRSSASLRDRGQLELG